MPISIGDALLKLGVDAGDLDRGLNQVSQHIQQGAEKWKSQIRAAGAAFTAIGVAGLKLADDARKMNAALSQGAITMGITTGEMRELALETTNVTFGLESVKNTFDLLIRAGVRNTEDLKATANAFDAIADATGDTAESIADKLIPAFKVFGLELPKTSEDMDKFTWLTKNTMVTLEEFAAAMDYVAAYGKDLDLTIEEMIASMAALEEQGITGSAVTRVFRTAITQAASGTVTLNEALGISQGDIDRFIGSMNDAKGITEEYAEAANKQYGIMDKLRQKWDELRLQLGSILEPAEALLAVMGALGPALLFVSTSAGRAALSLRGLKFGLAGLGVGGAAYGGYQLGKWISDVFGLGGADKLKESLRIQEESFAQMLPGLQKAAAAYDFYSTNVEELVDFLELKRVEEARNLQIMEDVEAGIETLTRAEWDEYEAKKASLEATIEYTAAEWEAIAAQESALAVEKERAEQAYILQEAYNEMIETARKAYQQALDERTERLLSGGIMPGFLSSLDAFKNQMDAVRYIGDPAQVIMDFAVAIQASGENAKIAATNIGQYILAALKVDAIKMMTEGMLEAFVKSVQEYGVGSEEADTKFQGLLDSIGTAIELVGQLGTAFGELGLEIPEGMTGGGAGIGWWLRGYQFGGIVPGPMGAAQLAVVHGGEKIIPPGDTYYDSHAQIVVNATIREEGDIRKLARKLYDLSRSEARSRGEPWP